MNSMMKERNKKHISRRALAEYANVTESAVWRMDHLDLVSASADQRNEYNEIFGKLKEMPAKMGPREQEVDIKTKVNDLLNDIDNKNVRTLRATRDRLQEISQEF